MPGMEWERIGPYRVEAQIGAGGMGAVYRARHVETGELAAVKVLPPALARQDGFVQRFSREVEALRQLTNPHIVRFLGSGADHETYFLAMEYVVGENLAQRLGRERRLAWREAVNIGIQLCAALKAAHDAGVIHRDLKPSNILLTAEGQVKLTDFGVAQLFAADRLTISGGVVGTAEYMSPEQAQGRRATNRSDLYSLGAVLYVLLTGRPPFTGATAVDVLQKHCFAQFDQPSRYVPEIPPWLDDVVADLLNKDPAKRPPDALAVSRRLREVLQRADRRVLEELTAVDREGVPNDNPTSPAPGAATLLRNFVKDEIRRGEPTSWWQGWLNHTAVLVAMLAGLAALVWWMQSRQLSPEQHLALARAVLAEPPSSDWLEARDKHLRPLLETDPDRFRAVVEPLLEEIALYELEQRLTLPRRRQRKSTPLSEPERLLADVRRVWEEGRLGEAQQRLTAVQRLLNVDPQADALRKLAARWQTTLAESGSDQPSAVDYVRQMLQRADDLAMQQPGEAQGIWEAIVDLYRSDLRLAAEVAEAQRRLQERLDETQQPRKEVQGRAEVATP
jgi:hypothetical protein